VKVRRVFAYVAFVFLLLSQQLGIMHAVSHITSDVASSSSKKKQLPSETQCEQCLAFAALGSGLSGSPPSGLPLQALTDAAIAFPLVILLPAAFRVFDSRAPPLRV
jgi:hypothetical protein